jgi:uncharacterized protein (DUF608 family)
MTRYDSNYATQAGFLLGGIGTGNITVGVRGELRDWEVFNRPGKQMAFPYSFFCIRTKEQDSVKMKVLESKFEPPFNHSHGISPENLGGLPRFESSVMSVEYPFVRVSLRDPMMPVSVTMESFTPFIPLDADNSGLPGAVIRYSVKNNREVPVEVSIAGSMANPVGFEGYNIWERLQVALPGKNEWVQGEESPGLFFTCPNLPSHHLSAGNMAIKCLSGEVFYKKEWLNSGWWDGLQDFWDELSELGELEPVSTPPPAGNQDTIETKLKVGSVGAKKTVPPNATMDFTFLVTWYFPNRIGSWLDLDVEYCAETTPIVRNYYSTLFKDSWDVALYLERNMILLEETSRIFADTLYSSSLPESVIEAAANNITVLRSPTCFRLEDGSFLGWEGCFSHVGCCAGSCNHVWNYAQTVAYLFPELERTMRRMEFSLELDGKGALPHRSVKTLDEGQNYHPAVDGQLGAIVRLYRDWVLSGDDTLVVELWPKACLAMDYVLEKWDTNGDSVLDGPQYVTYDIEFLGENSLTASLLLAALKAMAAMADLVGDQDKKDSYGALFGASSEKADVLLWNGEYYQQNIPDVNAYKYQYGTGCLSDQLFGQLLAHVCDLGYILPKEKVRKAILSVYNNNFLRSFREHQNPQRTYALNDEQGVVLCTWPKGNRPRFPFVYATEVWTGIEYQVAAHLIYENYVAEGLSIVEAVQDRHDGRKRNPWNEVECGNHYVRSMASWSLIPALSGMTFDPYEKTVHFSPKVDTKDFSCFWAVGNAWGTYKQAIDPLSGEVTKTFQVLFGDESITCP